MCCVLLDQMAERGGLAPPTAFASRRPAPRRRIGGGRGRVAPHSAWRGWAAVVQLPLQLLPPVISSSAATAAARQRVRQAGNRNSARGGRRILWPAARRQQQQAQGVGQQMATLLFDVQRGAPAYCMHVCGFASRLSFLSGEPCKHVTMLSLRLPDYVGTSLLAVLHHRPAVRRCPAPGCPAPSTTLPASPPKLGSYAQALKPITE